jgi:hypothetical protein
MKTFLLLTVIIFFTGSCDLIDKMKPAKVSEPVPGLNGSWKLINLKGVDPAGRVHYPYEKDVTGFATFDEHNYFTMQYYASSRPLLSKRDPYYCSDPEIRIAFLSGASCYGTYQLSGDSLFLRVTASINPSWSWSMKKSYFKLQGDTLLLVSSGRLLNGLFLREHSLWLRVN